MPTRNPLLPAVSTRYGAPMGRTAYGTPEHADPRTVRLFRVPLDSGGYDSGGAYWGHGAPIYCATDGDAFRQFYRASSRAAAVVLAGISPGQLCSEGPKLRAAVLRAAVYLASTAPAESAAALRAWSAPGPND